VRLDLVNLELGSANFHWQAPFQLPALESLGLIFVNFENMKSILDPDVLPSLRILVLDTLDFDEQQDLTSLLDSNITRLFPQLEALSLDCPLTNVGYETLFTRVLAKTLVDFDSPRLGEVLAAPSVAHVRHVSIGTYPAWLVAEVADVASTNWLLDFIASIEDQKWACLRSLYLEDILLSSSKLKSEVNHALQRLKRVCEDRKIEIVYDIAATGREEDSRIPQEFWRRQRACMQVNSRSG